MIIILMILNSAALLLPAHTIFVRIQLSVTNDVYNVVKRIDNWRICMEQYETLEMNVVFFSKEDVIVCSPDVGEEFQATSNP